MSLAKIDHRQILNSSSSSCHRVRMFVYGCSLRRLFAPIEQPLLLISCKEQDDERLTGMRCADCVSWYGAASPCCNKRRNYVVGWHWWFAMFCPSQLHTLLFLEQLSESWAQLRHLIGHQYLRYCSLAVHTKRSELPTTRPIVLSLRSIFKATAKDDIASPNFRRVASEDAFTRSSDSATF